MESYQPLSSAGTLEEKRQQALEQCDRLQHSGFRHFTVQSLDADEIHEFVDRWYDLSMGSDRDQVRLKQRLKEAIATRSDPKSGRQSAVAGDDGHPESTAGITAHSDWLV